jgi:Ca2+-binding EF-hand superfamily protein
MSFINHDEFSLGMNNLYSGSFQKLINLVFEFYDFDKDGKISKEDIRIVLSYIPLKIIDEKIKKYRGLKFYWYD